MTLKSSTEMSPEVTAVFDAYPQKVRSRLLFLRQLIVDTAASLDVGNLEETLKWGEPSYLTPETKSGSTIRLDWKEAETYAIYFKCTANLVSAFKEKYPETFNFSGNRSINFELEDDVPTEELKRCIALALTYHRNKKLEPAARWQMIEELI